MVLIVLHGLNGQNNEGRSLFDKGSTNRENTTNSLEYFFIKHCNYFCSCWWIININQ